MDDPRTVRGDDHRSGSGPVVVLYGDVTCHRCQEATRRLRAAPVELVWRHLVLRARGPRPRALAHALEGAARQGRFWPLLDRLLGDPAHTEDPDLWRVAGELGLDVPRFDADRRDGACVDRVDRDLRDALALGAVGTPAILVGDRPVDHGVPDERWIDALVADHLRR
ncbi:MAG: DsbA family protein [Solirubrobacteraceae bacterium]|nr:DsbA family protein [Solirubrobacteraceae bacterium]